MTQAAKIVDITRSFRPLDPGTMPATLHATKAEDYPDEVGRVVAYSGYNFMPTYYGYKSYFGITGKLAGAALDARVDFILVYEKYDLSRMLIALCEDGIYTNSCTSSTEAWVKVATVAVPPEGQHKNWTYCIIANKLYCYRAEHSSYFVFDTDGSCDSVVPTFLNMEGQRGIFKAGGRLGFWDSMSSVSWSSLDNLAEFTPSIETQAGNAIFMHVQGYITTILACGDGFMIYATSSIIEVRRNLDSQFQWAPVVILQGIGVAYQKQIATATPDTTQFAYTAVGLQKIEGGKADIVLAEVTDYLSGSADYIGLQMVENRYLVLHLLTDTAIDGDLKFEGQDVASAAYPGYIGPSYTYPLGATNVAADPPSLASVGASTGAPPTGHIIAGIADGYYMEQRQLASDAIAASGLEDIKPGTTATPVWRFTFRRRNPSLASGVGGDASMVKNGYAKLNDMVCGRYYNSSTKTYTRGTWVAAIGIGGSVSDSRGVGDDNTGIFYDWNSGTGGFVPVTPTNAMEFVPFTYHFGVWTNPTIDAGTTGDHVGFAGLFGVFADQKTMWDDDATKHHNYLFGLSAYEITRPTSLRPWRGPAWNLYTAWSTGAGGAYTESPASAFPTFLSAKWDDPTSYYEPMHTITGWQESLSRPGYLYMQRSSVRMVDHSPADGITSNTAPGIAVPTKADAVVFTYSPCRIIASAAYTKAAMRVITMHHSYLTGMNDADETRTEVISTTLASFEMTSPLYVEAEAVIIGWIYTGLSGAEHNIDALACPVGSTGSRTEPWENWATILSTSEWPVLVPGTPDGWAPDTLYKPIAGPTDSTFEVPDGPGSYTTNPWVVPSLELPDAEIMLRSGDPGPIYPTYYGAYLYDTALKKWGKAKLGYKELIDLSPVNTGYGAIVQTKRFGMDAAALMPTGYVHRLDPFPLESCLKYGKLGFYRLGMTHVEEVRATFRTPFTGYLTVETSLDGRSQSPELMYAAYGANALSITGYPDVPGRWHNIAFRGTFDITGLQYRAYKAGRR